VSTKLIVSPVDIGQRVWVGNSTDTKIPVMHPFTAHVVDVTMSGKVIVKDRNGKEESFTKDRIFPYSDQYHKVGEALLTYEYWDCGCPGDYYIHKCAVNPELREMQYCPVCGTHEEDSPNSHVRELKVFEKAKTRYLAGQENVWNDIRMHAINAGAMSYVRQETHYHGRWQLWGFTFFADKEGSTTDLYTEVAHYLADMKVFARFERPHSRAMVGRNLPVDDLGRHRERDKDKMFISHLQPLQ
jgi:hypothetical protein